MHPRSRRDFSPAALTRTLIVLATITLPLVARAEEWIILGPRAMGMGGAGVASARGGYAMYWNPASLGLSPLIEERVEPPSAAAVDSGESLPGETPGRRWRQGALPSFDLALHLAGSVAAVGDSADNLAELQDVLENLDFQQLETDFENGVPLSEADTQSALRAIDLLSRLDEEGEGMYVTAAAGAGVQSWRIGLTALGLAYGGAQPVVDLGNNIALGNRGIDDVVSGLPAPGPGDLDADSQAFADAIAAQGLATQTDAERLVFQAQNAGVDTGDGSFQTSVLDILQATQDADTGGVGGVADAITNNTSGARLRGLAIGELALGYAQPIGDFLSIGASGKLMYAATYLDPFELRDLSSDEEFIDDLYDEDNREEEFGWGLDVGVLLRPVHWLVLGVSGKNLNQPEFEFRDDTKVKLDPQVRAGVAVQPLSWLTLAADIDVIKNTSDVLPGYETQYLGGGAEFSILDMLYLRGGVSQNLRDTDEPLLLHAGLGVRVWYLSIDAAAILPADADELDELSNLDDRVNDLDDVPERAGFSVMAGLNIPF